MILYPLNGSFRPVSSSSAEVSVWDAIAQQQQQDDSSWWLITQPDHAALAGSLASALHSPFLPSLDDGIIQAIALHDAGWASFDTPIPSADGPTPRLSPTGRPLSFLDADVSDFLSAWIISIDRAAAAAPIGGIMVSAHFSRLGEMRRTLGIDSRDEAQQISAFLKEEAARRQRLAQQDRHSDAERGVLIDVLQFCDLLSLYLCCGSRQNVEFPQRFAGKTMRLSRQGEECCLTPALFGSGISLGIQARPFPACDQSPSVAIPFLLG